MEPLKQLRYRSIHALPRLFACELFAYLYSSPVRDRFDFEHFYTQNRNGYRRDSSSITRSTPHFLT